MTLSLAPAVHATATDTGMVLLDENSGRYWQLNPTGALILHALLDGHSADDAARQLLARHPQLDPAQAGRDVTALIENLLDSQLVAS
ncbi:lasso peptide biosynthesis PqqD family chaperone [Streptomyces uncialis]|uniref:lasso peptide biosynthesis PqqD family chaperone n=1 Tax=Streptomyces uncialis TaxID=1048205 RepID=UPI0037959517